MKAEYALNDQWRLMFGGEFCPFDVRITWNDARYNLPEAPLDLYPTSKFTLRYRNAKQNIVEGYFGIKHLFKGERWRPYIGLGHMTMRILPFETEFEFQKNWGTEIVEVTKKSDGKLISNMMLLSGGWEWQILPRLAFQTEGFYYKDINKTKRTYDQFGLRGALILGFK
jgi:hypothetical protein